jgi:hypothetical protein
MSIQALRGHCLPEICPPVEDMLQPRRHTESSETATRRLGYAPPTFGSWHIDRIKRATSTARRTRSASSYTMQRPALAARSVTRAIFTNRISQETQQ